MSLDEFEKEDKPVVQAVVTYCQKEISIIVVYLTHKIMHVLTDKGYVTVTNHKL